LPNLTNVRDRLVELYLRQQDRTNAAAQLRAVIRESPADPKAYYLLGSILFESRDVKEAAECFGKTLLLSPKFEPVYYDLAFAQINLDKPQEAIETLRKARDQFPENFVGEYYTGLAYSRMKDHTNSLKYYTSAEVIARATATNRLTHGFYFQIGAAYERTQNFKEAETYFRKALALSPEFSEALNYLGYMWAERGENLKEAREMIEKAIKLEPKNAAFLDSLGWVLFKLDKPEEALPHLLEAIKLDDDPDATLYDHLGDIYAALHKPDKAREAWKKALSIEPNEQIEKKLKASAADVPSPGSGPR
jgi:tetratricopeptide (TPR) repeat protein